TNMGWATDTHADNCQSLLEHGNILLSDFQGRRSQPLANQRTCAWPLKKAVRQLFACHMNDQLIAKLQRTELRTIEQKQRGRRERLPASLEEPFLEIVLR